MSNETPFKILIAVAGALFGAGAYHVCCPAQAGSAKGEQKAAARAAPCGCKGKCDCSPCLCAAPVARKGCCAGK